MWELGPFSLAQRYAIFDGMTKLAPFIVFALVIAGCGGTFEEAKNPNVAVGAPPQSERCAELDDRAAWMGGTAKFSGALAGASGLATIAVPDSMGGADEARVGLAISSAVMGGVAVGAGFISSSASTSWARECAQ